jgi:hypothetical protein
MGLIRELDNPLGYSAGSDVFRQRTELLPDGALDGPRSFSLCVSPFPGSLSFFLSDRVDGEWRAGGIAAVDFTSEFSLELLVELASDLGGNSQEGWFLPHPVFHGGRIAHAGVRLMGESSSGSLALTLGVSGAREMPPGILMDIHISMGRDGYGAEILLGAATPDYLTLEGKGSRDRFMSGVKLHVSGPAGSVMFRCSFAVLQPQFAPSPYLSTRGTLGFSIDGPVWCLGVRTVRIRLQGENDLTYDPGGDRSDSASCGMFLVWLSAGDESRVGVEFSSAAAETSCVLRFRIGSFSCAAECGLCVRKGGPVAAARFDLRGRIPDWGTMGIEVGLRDLPLDGAMDPFAAFRMRIDWSSIRRFPSP